MRVTVSSRLSLTDQGRLGDVWEPPWSDTMQARNVLLYMGKHPTARWSA